MGGGGEVMGGGGVWWILDFKEERDGGELSGCTAEWGKMGKRGRNDLKIGPGTAQLEYVRTHISAFDRTRAWCKWCKRALRSNL
jgi:hypothetical protein